MSKEALPANLSPFATNHPASSAYRITLSEHEWTWTQAEQEAMARAVVELDGERQKLRAELAKTRPACHDEIYRSYDPPRKRR